MKGDLENRFNEQLKSYFCPCLSPLQLLHTCLLCSSMLVCSHTWSLAALVCSRLISRRTTTAFHHACCCSVTRCWTCFLSCLCLRFGVFPEKMSSLHCRHHYCHRLLNRIQPGVAPKRHSPRIASLSRNGTEFWERVNRNIGWHWRLHMYESDGTLECKHSSGQRASQNSRDLPALSNNKCCSRQTDRHA